MTCHKKKVMSKVEALTAYYSLNKPFPSAEVCLEPRQTKLQPLSLW